MTTSKFCRLLLPCFADIKNRQLLPTNTSSRGRTQYNYYSDRLDIPLPNRLEMEGFPCHRLLEQRRMHEAISAFPNTIVYEGKLRDGPGMDVSLEAHMPGLREVLLDIVSSASIPAGGQSTPWLTDNDLRRHYIEVYGRKVEYEKSVAVLEHIDVFMVQIFPKLFKFFRASGRSMKEEVMIICAYNYAVSKPRRRRSDKADPQQRSEYDRRIKEFLRQRPECTINDIPRIMSIDSSQGDESFMVFLDASLQSGDRVGESSYSFTRQWIQRLTRNRFHAKQEPLQRGHHARQGRHVDDRRRDEDQRTRAAELDHAVQARVRCRGSDVPLRGGEESVCLGGKMWVRSCE